jgi:L-methionine (R)-S-oxide reductase
MASAADEPAAAAAGPKPMTFTGRAKAEEYALMEAALAKFFAKYAVDTCGRMATISSYLRLHFPRNVFCGFYTVVRPPPLAAAAADAAAAAPASAGALQIGPYNGNESVLACGLIDFGKGVCGACASARETQVVPDVRLHPNYIACDDSSLSEIVVPVFGRNRHDEPDAAAGDGGERSLIAVLDLDADVVSAYDEVDRECLERLCARFF